MAGAEWTHPLGKMIIVRIDRKHASLGTCRGRSRSSVVDGCKLSPSGDVSAESTSRRTCDVSFMYISQEFTQGYASSTKLREGKGVLQGTVQWNETVYM